MEKKIMKTKSLFLVLFLTLNSYSQNKFIHNIKMTIPGTILNNIDFNSIDSITELTISGYINNIDIQATKRMKSLKKLDISNAIIVYNKETLNSAIKKAYNNYESAKTGGYSIMFGYVPKKSPQEIQKLKVEADLEAQKISAYYKSNVIIEDYLFEEFYSLEYLFLPKNVQSVGYASFRNCNNLKEIILPPKLSIIGNYAFDSCDSLTQITLPNSMTKIGSNAFEDCKSLIKCIIKGNINEIKAWTFDGCVNLEELSIPPSVKKFDICALRGCDSLKTIHCYAINAPAIYYDGPLDGDSYYVNKVATCFFPKSSTTSYLGSKWGNYFTIKPE